MTTTISTHKETTANQKHNRRDRETVEKERENRKKENEKRRKEGKRPLRDLRIDPSKTPLNDYWIDEPVGKAYRRIFQKSVDDYNSKQKRSDRKISSYYKQVLTSKTQHPAYEFVLMIGNKNAHPDDSACKTMLREFVDGWKRLNPSLELIGAYYHADEATPHVHLDFVPVVDNCKRGLAKQTGLLGALTQQRQKKGKDFWKRDEKGNIVRDDDGHLVKLSRLDIEKEWTREQNEALEKIVRSHGYEVKHPQRGQQDVQHRSIDEYEEVQSILGELKKEREGLEKTEQQLDRFLDKTAGTSKTGRVLTYRDLYEQFLNTPNERDKNPHPYRPHGSGDDFSK